MRRGDCPGHMMQLLAKAGWKEGQGLGSEQQGRLTPVPVEVKMDKKGVGAPTRKRPLVGEVADPQKKKKNKGGAAAGDGDADGSRKGVLEDVNKKAYLERLAKEQAREVAIRKYIFEAFRPDNV
eukprot:jgi/Mesvir1/19109/Mv12854-RA.1